MAISQQTTTIAVLRRILGPDGQEKRFAEAAGKSVSWVKKVSAGLTPLTEEIALELEKRTGISAAWLLQGDTHAPAVSVDGGRYDLGAFEGRRAKLERRTVDLAGTMRALAGISVSAAKRGNGSLFDYRLSQFLKACGEEFGYGEVTTSRTKPVKRRNEGTDSTVAVPSWENGLDVQLL